MRTLVDIPKADIVKLDEISAREKVSRAAIIRQAVAQLIAARDKDALEAGFGAWKGLFEEDSVAFVRRLRDEW